MDKPKLPATSAPGRRIRLTGVRPLDGLVGVAGKEATIAVHHRCITGMAFRRGGRRREGAHARRIDHWKFRIRLKRWMVVDDCPYLPALAANLRLPIAESLPRRC